MTARVAVVGAGPAGLSAALRLAQSGAEVEVLEGSPDAGGLARSLTLWGRDVDLGSHVLDDSRPATRHLLDELLPGRLREVPLRRGLVVDGRCYEYPLRPADVVRRSSVRTVAALGAGLARRRHAERGPVGSATEWIVRRYGRAAYERFFAAYAMKRAGVAADALDASFASGLTGADDGNSRRFRPAPGAAAYRRSFRYPDGGMGAITAALAERVRTSGGTLRTSTAVRSVAADGARLAVGTDTGTERYDAAVATIPLGLLARVVEVDQPASDTPDVLPRATVLVYVEHRGDAFPELWRYVTDPGRRAGRVANLDRWGDATYDSGILCCELWCTPGDDTWQATDDVLAADVTAELLALGMVRAGSTARTHVERVAGTHAVPLIGAPQRIARRRAALEALPGLVLAGTAAGVTDVGGALSSGVAAARRIAATLDLDEGTPHALSRPR